MTKIRQSGDSSMIEDRRGQSSGSSGGGLGFPFPTGGGGGGGGGGMGFPLPTKMGGGMIGLLLLLAVMFLPKLLKGGGLGGSTAGGQTPITVQSPNIAPDPDSSDPVQDANTGDLGRGA